MTAPLTHRQNAGWHRFRLGAFEGTVVWDGYIHHGYEGIFPNAPAEEMARLQQAYRLPSDHIPMDLNPVVINTGEKLYLIDTGMGPTVTWWGETMGHLLPNLSAAGIAPEQIDAILITHLHPDHCFGLLDALGRPAFPNAEVYVSDDDWAEWTDQSSLRRTNSHHASWTEGALKSIEPYRDRVKIFKAGDRLAPELTTFSVRGHAAGMVAYIFESEGEKMAFTGDVCHHQVYDPYHPEWFFHMDFDTSPEQGAASKRAIFEKCVAEDILFHGYHFPYPGMGEMVDHGDGTYRFLPTLVNPRL
jgi:glyoxylase-like metal-dependent hydrolase (beta-lactamase superfamily II)